MLLCLVHGYFALALDMALFAGNFCTEAKARFGFSTKLENIKFLTALLLERGFSDIASCRLLSS